MNDVYRQVGDLTAFTPGNETAAAQLHAENERLRKRLSGALQHLEEAREGLANYARELENAKHDIERLMESVSGEANEVERLRAGNERLKAHMRNVAGWLNNGCEPSKGAGELLLVAGLPPPQTPTQSEKK